MLFFSNHQRMLPTDMNRTDGQAVGRLVWLDTQAKVDLKHATVGGHSQCRVEPGCQLELAMLKIRAECRDL